MNAKVQPVVEKLLNDVECHAELVSASSKFNAS
jgi:hypothetical protein